MNRYQILYKGNLADSNITERGAKAKAFQLIKDKEWDVKYVQVVDSFKAKMGVK